MRLIQPKLPEKYQKIAKLKSLLIRRGNKERSTSFYIGLMSLLKQKYKNAFLTLDKSLYLLLPAFILRRTFVAGKFYNLPVPISSNRSAFMAADWLRKAAFKDNKNAFTVPYLLAREVSLVLNKTGSACSSLRSYIDIALDQRPFSRYIRRKRKVVSRSKVGKAAFILSKRFRKNKKRLGRRKGRNIYKKRKMIKRRSYKNSIDKGKQMYKRK